MICYGVQMVICYQLGQKYYPIPYPVKKLLSILALSLIFYGIYISAVKYFISPMDVHGIQVIFS